VGAVTQEVTVTAGDAPLFQTETGQQGDIMVASSIEELPQLGAGITGNDWANFIRKSLTVAPVRVHVTDKDKWFELPVQPPGLF